MARLNPTMPREVITDEPFLGKIIVFCEGMTEENYFGYFAEIINNNPNKFSYIEIQIENAEGNSKTVLNHAESFMSRDDNSSKYRNYDKYLVFDCDDPKGDGEIQKVINDMIVARREDPYVLLPTMYMFETWLLMHMVEVTEAYSKTQLLAALKEHLFPHEYEKNSKGCIRSIIHDGETIVSAINNAKKLESKYKEMGQDFAENIDIMNPFTLVHRLVEKLLIEIAE